MMLFHTGHMSLAESSELLVPFALMMYNLPLLSNTSQEFQKLEPNQSQPASARRSTDK